MPVQLNMQFNVATLLAAVAGEVFCQVWHSEASPWGHYGSRFIITSLLANLGLAVMLQTIVRRYWHVNKVQDAAQMVLALALLYAALQGPHDVWGVPSLWKFIFVCANKFALMFVMTMVMYSCKKMNKFQ